jgi:hypothetical protein
MALGKGKIDRFARIYVGGYDLSGDARQFGSLDNGFDEVDFTGWSDTVRQFNGGYRNAGVRDFQALINDSTGRSYGALKTANTTGGISVLFGSNAVPAVGNTAYLLGYVQISAGTSFDGGAGVINASFLPASSLGSSGTNPLGWTLNPIGALSGDGDTVDTGVTAGAGWSANLHVTTLGTSGTFTIEHSTSAGSGYATLGTFTANGTAVTSEHLSGTATVNRYVRATGSGTAVIVITFARNNFS